MDRIGAVIFDLDNVLYAEEEYIFAAYRSIAEFLSKKSGLSSQQIYDRLVSAWRIKTSMYPRLFNDLVANLGLEQDIVPEILSMYVGITPILTLYPGAEDVLGALRKRRIKLGLLTNGNVEAQRNKVRLLGLEKFFDTIVYAREKGKENEKPNPRAYREILQALHVTPKQAICVGDNPHTDFWGAKKLGMRTVRLLCGEFKDVRVSAEYEADVTVQTLGEFLRLIEQRN